MTQLLIVKNNYKLTTNSKEESEHAIHIYYK